MKTLKLAAVAGVALAVAACPADREPVIEDPAFPPTEEPAPPPVATEQAMLQEIGGSGVAGEIHVTPRDNQVDVMLMVRNAPPNENIGARVHSGTCESPGPELARLDAISTDDMGQGNSETRVGHAPQLILDGNHIAALYAPGAEPEQDLPIACATLPETGAQFGAPGATQPGTEPGATQPGTQPGATQPGTEQPGTTTY